LNKALTWLELSRVANGTRVVFASPWDIFPEIIIPQGTEATIRENSLNEICCSMLVLPDSDVIKAALEAWDGEIFLDGPEHIFDESCPVSVTNWEGPSPLALLT
jgi:hypothetical protein